MKPTTVDNDVPTVTDSRLWDRVRDGDADALGILYDRHANAVFGFAFRRTASWAAAEDVLQTTFLKAWKTLSGGTQGPLQASTARGWLLVLAGNECHNVNRAARRLRLALERLPRPQTDPDHADDVARRIDDEERMSAVRRAVGKLPRHERETLELVIWSGLTIADTAAALDLPVGTVKARLHRARRRLPDLLATIDTTEETS